MFTFRLDSSITVASGKTAAADFGANVSSSVKGKTTASQCEQNDFTNGVFS